MEIGRIPRLLTTAGDNEYASTTDGMWEEWRVYKSTKRYLSRFAYIIGRPEEHVRYDLTDRFYGACVNRIPFTSVFWLRLRLWMRRARRAVFTKALVRYHTPSLLGKRRR